jgi:hypothetical protein
LSEKVYARDLMSCGATDFGAGGCRARGPTLGAAMALLTALVLGGCMQATLNPVSDANFTARDNQQLTNPPYQQAWIPPAYQRQIGRQRAALVGPQHLAVPLRGFAAFYERRPSYPCFAKLSAAHASRASADVRAEAS